MDCETDQEKNLRIFLIQETNLPLFIFMMFITILVSSFYALAGYIEWISIFEFYEYAIRTRYSPTKK
jgi:hypothetical protein